MKKIFYQQKSLLFSTLIAYVVFAMPFAAASQSLAIPPQDLGLPYTRTAQAKALKAIEGTIALFPQSRYAYLNGMRVRLDDVNKLECWSVLRNGKLFVSEAFAGAIVAKKITFQPIPKELENLKSRWVYKAEFPKVDIPISVEKMVYRGMNYFSVSDFAKISGKQFFQSKRGLLLISDSPIHYNEKDSLTDDCVVTLFDTPEKYADPDIATRNIPILKEQGKWTDHAKITPEQLNDLENGEETQWVLTPRSDYRLDGFNTEILGSKVPATGVYPRLLFSEQDLPVLRKNIQENKSAQKSMIEIEVLFKKSWWNETSSDGKIFKLLYEGKLDEIRSQQEFPKPGAATYHVAKLTKDHTPGIFNTHVNYVTNCLSTMAMYALLTDNNELGAKVAKATVSYYRLIEPKVDEHLKKSDTEFGINPDDAGNSTTHWRGMHGVVPHMDMPFNLDFAGKWMSEEDKKFMQSFIAKATYGRRTGGGDGPKRAWRDHNHLTWHLTHFLALAAIEGCDGFDEEAYLSGAELTRDFLEYGIDDAGQMFESNGKSGGGLQFEFLSMLVMARRGDNLFGHPHLRKVLEAQVHITSPNGQAMLSSGTFSGVRLSPQFIAEMKCFYPNEKNADYLLTQNFPALNLATFDLDAYKTQIEKKTGNLRLPGPTYPNMDILGFPYIKDWTYMSDKNMLETPLNWQTSTYGMFSASSNKTKDAAWVCLQVRDNHYIGSGHHHADEGMFYFSGEGVNWITESPFAKTYNGKYHNLVLIDSISESDMSPAKGTYLGAEMKEKVSFASADLSYAYSWEWNTQVAKWGEAFSKLNVPYKDFIWELETRPEILKIFRGTTHYKMRPWCSTSNQSNFIATLRAPWNPVEYVYRTTGLVNGKHAYGIVVDDLKKDKNSHLYQWSAMLGAGVWTANYAQVPKGCAVLAYNKVADDKKNFAPTENLLPQNGDPLLLVYPLGMTDQASTSIKVEVAKDGVDNGKGKGIEPYTRIVIEQKAVQANFRVLLLPFRMGKALPKISYKNGIATVQFENQKDILKFNVENNRTKLVVQ